MSHSDETTSDDERPRPLHQTTHHEPFPATQLSQVDRAGEGDGEALRQVLSRYHAPLRWVLRSRWRIDSQTADDHIQGFIADKLLERQILSRYDPARGKFRTFLLTALLNYVRDRIGKKSPEMLDENTLAQPELESALDRQWARQVLQLTLQRVKEECHEKGQAQVWELFDVSIMGPTLRGEERPSAQALLAAHSLESEQQVANLLMTGKRKFQRTLREVIAEYVALRTQTTPDDPQVQQRIDEEMRDLWQTLAGGER